MSGNRKDHDPPAKRFKRDDDDDNLWGEELDESTLEECFFLASQVLSEDKPPEPLPSKSESGSSKQEPGPSKSSPEIFKKPIAPASFRPKQPSLIASSSSFTKKVPSSLSQSDKFTRKVPATSSQSETFPKQTHGTPTQLQVYPRKSPAAGTSRPVPPVSKPTLPRSTHTFPSRPMESPASKSGPSSASVPKEQLGSTFGTRTTKSPASSLSGQRSKDPDSTLASSYSEMEEIFPRGPLPGTSTDMRVDDFGFAVKNVPQQGVLPRSTGAYLDTSMFTSESTVSASQRTRDEMIKDEMYKEMTQLRLANKKLQDDLLSKDGEVAILRSQMNTLQLDLTKQRLMKMQELEDQAVKFREKVKQLEKELEQKDTQLEFKTLEIGNAEERCRLLESHAKLKFVDPQSPQVGGNFPDKPVPTSSKTEKHKERAEGKKHKNIQTEPMFKNIIEHHENDDVRNINFTSSDGYILGTKISPYIFQTTLYNADRTDRPHFPYLFSRIYGGTLTPRGPSVKVFYTHLSKLFKFPNFDRWKCKIIIQDIVWEAFKILRKQLNWLQWHKKRFTEEELYLLDYNLCAEAGKRYRGRLHLLCAKKLYPIEQSVEVRRTLVLLAVLARMNDFAAEYMTGKISKKVYFSLTSFPAEQRKERMRRERLRKKMKPRKISRRERQRREEEKRQAEMRAQKKKEAEERQKILHEKAMDDELEALGLKKEDWVDYDPDKEIKRCKSPIAIIRNYVIKCRKMNRLSHLKPPVDLSIRPHEKKGQKMVQSDDRTDDGDESDDKKDVDSAQSSVKAGPSKERTTKSPLSEKIYLIHPVEWKLKFKKYGFKEVGYKFEKKEIKWTPFKKTLDEWAKNLLLSPREKEERWKAFIEKLMALLARPKVKKRRPRHPLFKLKGEKLEKLREMFRTGKIPPPKKHEIPLFCDSGRKYDFLEHLYQIVEIICNWRFTVTCNGLLLALVILIRSIVIRVNLTEDRYPVVIKLIKDVILCRPSINVLTQLIDLLGWLTHVQPIQESLCNGSGPNPHLTIREGIIYFHEGVPRYEVVPLEDVYWFKRSSCMITMIAWQIAVRRADPMHHAMLGTVTIEWLQGVMNECDPLGTNWIGPAKDKELRDCQCRPRILEAVIILMHSCYEHLEKTKFYKNATFRSVNDFLGISMTFFKDLIHRDNDMGVLISNAEGEYQLVIHGLRKNVNEMKFNDKQKDALQVLIDLERQHTAMIPRVQHSEKASRLLGEAFRYTDKAAYFDCFYDTQEYSDTEPESDSD